MSEPVTLTSEQLDDLDAVYELMHELNGHFGGRTGWLVYSARIAHAIRTLRPIVKRAP